MIVKTFCPCASQEPEGADQVESIKAPKDTERILKQQVQQRSFNRSFHTNSFISIGGNNSFISSGGAPEDANSRSAAPVPPPPLTLEVCCSSVALIPYTTVCLSSFTLGGGGHYLPALVSVSLIPYNRRGRGRLPTGIGLRGTHRSGWGDCVAQRCLWMS